MSNSSDYPPKFSRVSIVMLDGELKTYDITAGCGLLPYLMREASKTGMLVILNGPEAFAIPMDRVSDVSMREFASVEEREAFYTKTN